MEEARYPTYKQRIHENGKRSEPSEWVHAKCKMSQHNRIAMTSQTSEFRCGVRDTELQIRKPNVEHHCTPFYYFESINISSLTEVKKSWQPIGQMRTMQGSLRKCSSHQLHCIAFHSSSHVLSHWGSHKYPPLVLTSQNRLSSSINYKFVQNFALHFNIPEKITFQHILELRLTAVGIFILLQSNAIFFDGLTI